MVTLCESLAYSAVRASGAAKRRIFLAYQLCGRKTRKDPDARVLSTTPLFPLLFCLEDNVFDFCPPICSGWGQVFVGSIRKDDCVQALLSEPLVVRANP
jgi:hypothetical protein